MQYFFVGRSGLARFFAVLPFILLTNGYVYGVEGRPGVNYLPAITNVMQFQQFARGLLQTNWPVRLKGIVCWSDMQNGMIVLQDYSGAALVETPPRQESIRPGDEISLTGYYGGSQGRILLRVGTLSLFDDCSDGMRERSDTISLETGFYPVSVSWFDGGNLDGLDVLYDGPNLARQSIPDSELFHIEGHSSVFTNWSGGVHYRAYFGSWQRLPEFAPLTPIRQGIAPNFSIGNGSRGSGNGVEFDGFIRIEQAGIYRFTIVPHGRGQLFVDRPVINVISVKEAPKPRLISAGQIAPDGVRPQWSEVEGVVTYLSGDGHKGLTLELSSGSGNIRVYVIRAQNSAAGLLLGSHVRITGISQSVFTAEEQRIFGELYTPGLGQVVLLDVNPELWTSHPLSPANDLNDVAGATAAEPMVRVEGIVRTVNKDGSIILNDGTGDIQLHLRQLEAAGPGDYVEALGNWVRSSTNAILENSFFRKIEETVAATNPLPVLTTAEQVKRLNRYEALRQYPVRIRGVVTWSGGSGFVIQDSTLGVFAETLNTGSFGIQRDGECLEVEGVTTAQFSPMILAQQIVDLGPGSLPEPVRPTWDQLMDGTLDTQYTEIQGIVTALEENKITLLTHDGRLQVFLPEMRYDRLSQYADALVRIRGCLWAVKNEVTHALIPGEIEIHDPSICIDQPAPRDPFSAPFKHASELLLFDAKAGALQRLKVIGQIVHKEDGEYYLMDGANGLRFIPRKSVQLQVGDQVEVVGFPLLGGPSPVLREALVRTIGHYPLLAATTLPENSLLNGSYDSTLVKVDAQLMNISEDQEDSILGLQAGSSMFTARFNRNKGSLSYPPIGSRLEVTGVYAGQGGGRVAGHDIDSFELLLNSPSDIRVLARPSWWTIKRVFAVAGILLGVLVVALVWIGLLRRQVEQRTEQLKREVIVRQRAEQQRAVEEERSRIARDLHDDLGAGLTEITMLADAGAGSPPGLEKANQRLQSISHKARAVVHAMDVIVWLVNPSKDVLPYLVGYIGSYAEEYLAAAGIACRLKVPPDVPALPLTAQVRHNLFLAVKETLNNIVRHSHATEAIIEIAVRDSRFKIAITDNGKGFNPDDLARRNGLLNLQSRMANIGGHCEVTSKRDRGTVVLLALPLLNT
ncbi:MAG TPA: ATP-binding protein [Candidatus Sulfotelmatobacter sp.]|nr:ATP-binding protein [Candidatus Sulfotelmatobacter sp.]